MGRIKPIGSEKLQGMDKIKRMIEIARYNENIPMSVNETFRSDYIITLADGNTYEIVKERLGYIIKSSINESDTEYIDPIQERKYFKSYSQALRRLNLMAKEINENYGNEEGILLIGEEKKKFILNPNKKKQKFNSNNSETPISNSVNKDNSTNIPNPVDSSMGDMPSPVDSSMGGNTQPVDSSMGGNTQPVDSEMGGNTQPVDSSMGDMPSPVDSSMGDMPSPVDSEMGDMPSPVDSEMGGNTEPVDSEMGGNTEPVDSEMGGNTQPVDSELGGNTENETENEKMSKKVPDLKRIQILVGKLASKIRTYEESKNLQPKDIKYIINSILSAIDVNSLSDDDIEQIISKLEGDEDEDENKDSSGSSEENETNSEEMPQEMGETYDNYGEAFQDYIAGGYTRAMSDNLKEDDYDINNIDNEFQKFDDNEKENNISLKRILRKRPTNSHYHLNHGTYNESKVDKIITGYFQISENELNHTYKKLVESEFQLKSLREFLKENSKSKFLGKTNKGNLIFKLNNREYKITKSGAIL